MSELIVRTRFARLTNYFSRIVDTTGYFFQRQWQHWKPRVYRVMHASIAITTATNTFKLSVEVMPIILSMLTVIATAPLFSGLLPAFIFDKGVMFITVLAIAGIAGYYKFNELVIRTKLDAQIKKNRVQGRQFARKMIFLNRRLTILEKKQTRERVFFKKPHTPGFVYSSKVKALFKKKRPTSLLPKKYKVA